ncbi:unnamed protein product [Linum trigynum]|uniref:MAR-binding filament-like protein 1-1 n=1 Tax=Linum trigynum TaxID=586398 RepID=A0AAV2C795_9ROSI
MEWRSNDHSHASDARDHSTHSMRSGIITVTSTKSTIHFDASSAAIASTTKANSKSIHLHRTSIPLTNAATTASVPNVAAAAVVTRNTKEVFLPPAAMGFPASGACLLQPRSSTSVFFLSSSSPPIRSFSTSNCGNGVAAVVSCLQADPDDAFRRKRRAALVGFLLRLLLHLRARALGGPFGQEVNELEIPEHNHKEEVWISSLVSVQAYPAPGPFLSLLNELGSVAIGVLGKLCALTRKEKKAADSTIQSMNAKPSEKETVIRSLEKNYELQLLNELEERKNQLNKATEEQQVLTNQLNLANNTDKGLGNDLTNERKAIEELKLQIEDLENSLSKAGHQKNALEQEPKGKLSSVEGLQVQVKLLGIELKRKEDIAQNLTSSLVEMKNGWKSLMNAYSQMKKDLTRAHTEISGLKDGLLLTKQQLDLKNALMNKLELGEREEEIQRLTESLYLAIKEANGKDRETADLNEEREAVKRVLETESTRRKILKHKFPTTQEALAKLRHEASGLETLLRQSRTSCTKLETELSSLQEGYAAAAASFQRSFGTAKQSSEIFAHERGRVKKTTDGLKSLTNELAAVREDCDNLQSELADVYEKAEADVKEKLWSYRVWSSSKEIQSVEQQMLKDMQARKALELTLEQASVQVEAAL